MICVALRVFSGKTKYINLAPTDKLNLFKITLVIRAMRYMFFFNKHDVHKHIQAQVR